jgi:hypothetical protein
MLDRFAMGLRKLACERQGYFAYLDKSMPSRYSKKTCDKSAAYVANKQTIICTFEKLYAHVAYKTR